LTVRTGSITLEPVTASSTTAPACLLLPIERLFADVRADINADEASGKLSAAEAERERQYAAADLYNELQNL